MVVGPAPAPPRREEAKRQREREKVEARNKRLREAKERRERRRQERIDAERAAVSGGKFGVKRLAASSSTGATGPTNDTGAGGDGNEMTSSGDRVGLLAESRAANEMDGEKPGSSLPKGIFKRRHGGGSSGRNKKLTFAERVELQNRKDEARAAEPSRTRTPCLHALRSPGMRRGCMKAICARADWARCAPGALAWRRPRPQEAKRVRDEKEMKRLRKLAEKQEKREAARLLKAEQQKEREEWDPDLYEEPSSDPYIVFSIDPPTNPGCKILRSGGYFGRTVRTDMVTNTLNPSFEEARKPLAYLGTRSELESEILRIRVFDWDFFSADDLIGQADVPLNGLLEYGQVEVELTLDLPDTKQKKVRGKHPKKTVPAGRLMGQILFEGRTPEYNQIGAGIVERKPGTTYLAVRLNSASKLTAADPNGSSDPFVTVDWDGAQQQTKVVARTLEPVWKQTLFFPLKLITLNTPALASKPPVSIRVFDMDEAGHDLLGSCEIPLHRITSAEHAKIDDEFGMDGRAHRGRVFAQRQLPLTLPGHRIQSTINVELYFTPDLPLDIQLEEEAEHKAQDLNEEYMARLMPFYKSLPARTRSKLEKSMRLELGKGEEYELGKAQLKRLVSAEDQDAVEHLFCEYLSPQQPPTDMSDPMHIARMVRCVTWADDSVIFKKDSRKDVWQSPPFFMMMRQGDTEDHALLMCNLLLGLNLDAYVCVGRLRGCSEREKRHVWVMTREPDGDVRIWETKTGTCLTLVERWYGKKLSAAERYIAQKNAPLLWRRRGQEGPGGYGRAHADALDARHERLPSADRLPVLSHAQG